MLRRRSPELRSDRADYHRDDGLNPGQPRQQLLRLSLILHAHHPPRPLEDAPQHQEHVEPDEVVAAAPTSGQLWTISANDLWVVLCCYTCAAGPC